MGCLIAGSHSKASEDSETIKKLFLEGASASFLPALVTTYFNTTFRILGHGSHLEMKVIVASEPHKRTLLVERMPKLENFLTWPCCHTQLIQTVPNTIVVGL